MQKWWTNIEKWTKNGAKIQKNDLQKSMSKIDANKCEKGTPQVESGSIRNRHREPTIQQDILRIGTILGKKLIERKYPRKKTNWKETFWGKKTKGGPKKGEMQRRNAKKVKS